MIRQAHRVPTRARVWENHLDKVALVFAIVGLGYFVFRAFTDLWF
jgi:hypothetical protein